MAGSNDRGYWLKTMQRIADPVLNALSKEQLKQKMPVESSASDRDKYTHLEAFGRLICGMAPWLEHGPQTGEEGVLRNKYAALIRQGITVGTDPESPDYMNFTDGGQPIVDAAFLAHAIYRSPDALYNKLSFAAKRNLVKALKQTRTRKPVFSNWLLFSAIDR